RSTSRTRRARRRPRRGARCSWRGSLSGRFAGSAVQPPAACDQLLAEPLGDGREYGDLGEAERLAQPVLEMQVLEVHPGVADVVQQPRELARLVGDEDDDDGVRGGCG